MKKSEVPQDNGRVFEKGSRELYYAVDENGEYTTALSTGWDAKNIVQDHTMQEIQERIDTARAGVKAGHVSPIVYFMELRRMDWQIVSDYTGIWKWRVKRHAKPAVFERLSDKTLKKYAEAFEISINELRNYKGN
ncbi:hypothetical protein BC792_10825 [Sphingobacterium allocomposti]|uniref:HTH cro/C1-type domain-containing protein n=1 Tax=Sphingobacterium allocomposti TaxID=415956 RepID=A0A5S5DJZ1_9SPHI|nr:hypothetical protein [Sphingobacterium composti Yoo et al. 2007 non Ten et al. 2007]TYP95934.1 hypothetical protein BC792_10825 [Sphingobacterium composti Yoo et al. 2007 non Ten et al. 2007]